MTTISSSSTIGIVLISPSYVNSVVINQGGAVTAIVADAAAPGDQAAIDVVSGNSDPGPTVAGGSVVAGGTAGAAQTVVSGGAAQQDAIGSGATLTVAGGTAGTTDGSLTVTSGGGASFDTIGSGNGRPGPTVTGGSVVAGGTAAATTSNAGASQTVVAGGAAQQDAIGSGAPLTLAGGTAGTTDGSLTVTSGGSASIDTIGGGGGTTASSGGSASTTTVNDVATVVSGGSISDDATQAVTYDGGGLVFDNTYGPDVTPAYQSAIIAAENFYQSNFTNAVTISLTFDTENGGTSGGTAESFHSYMPVSYATLSGSLASHAISQNQLHAVSALPATDPSGGSGFQITDGLADILGLYSGPVSGTVDLNSSDTFFYNQIPVSGAVDAVSALEHEISEMMGRVGFAGISSTLGVMDLFRYTSAGVLDDTGGSDKLETYFAIEPGDVSSSTSLLFNNSVQTPGDAADWNASPLGGPPAVTEIGGFSGGAYDSYGVPLNDQLGIVSPTDLEVMNVIGWDLNPVQSFTAAYIEALTTDGIVTLADSGVTTLKATDASVVLTVAHANTLINTSVAVSAPPGDTVTVADTLANILQSEESSLLPSIGVTGVTIADKAAKIEAISSTEIPELATTYGITAIAATDASIELSVAQAAALEAASIVVTAPSSKGYIVYIKDTATHVETLTAAAIEALPGIGVSGILVTDISVVLTFNQAIACEIANIKVTAGNVVTLVDDAGYIESLTVAGIAGLPGIGVSAIEATGGSVVLTVAKAMALVDASITIAVPPGDNVTVTDTVANILALGPAEIGAMGSLGVTAWTIADTAAHIEAIQPVALANFSEVPITGIASTDGSVVLTVDQAVAIEGDYKPSVLAVTVPAGDTVTVADTVANLETLTAAEIAGLPAIGVSGITTTTGLFLTVVQLVALEGTSLTLTVPTGILVTLLDTASNIEGLTLAEIAGFRALSVSGIIPTDAIDYPKGTPLTVAQIVALQTSSINLDGNVHVNVTDTAANIETLTPAQITQLSFMSFLQGAINIVSTDASLALTVAQIYAFLSGGAGEDDFYTLTVPAGNTVTIADTAANIESFIDSSLPYLGQSSVLTSELRGLGATSLAATDGSVQLSVADVLVLEAVRFVVTAPAGHTVSVADTAADIESLTSTQITTLKAFGVTAIAATDASIRLTVARAVALEGTSLVVAAPTGDTVTIADTIANIDALTAVQFAALSSVGVSAVTVADTAADIEALTPGGIATLASVGVTTITASDASVQLTVAQAVAVEGGASLVVAAPTGDTVTIADTVANIDALTAAQFAALSSIGVSAVTVADTAADIEALTPGQISTLASVGVSTITASDASVQLTVAQAEALEGTPLVVAAPTGDTVTIADTAANIESLTAPEITPLPATGVSAVVATDASVQFTVAQALAFEGASVAVTAPAGDTVTISDTEAVIDTLTAEQIALLPAIGVSGITVASLTGLGPITIDGGITLTVAGGVSSNQTITFTGAGGVLGLADPLDMNGTVSGFASPDTIDLTGAVYDPSATANPEPGNVLQIVENSGIYQVNFDPSQDFLNETFAVGPDQGTGTDITLVQVPLSSYATVPAGETVYGITVANGGTLDVSAIGALSGGTVSSGGTLDVENRGTATGATIDDGGTQNVFPGGTANDTVLDGSATQYVFGTASVTTVESGDSQIVEFGGLAISTTVEGGGSEIVSPDGTTSDTVINGGMLDVQSGGVVSGGITFAAIGGTLEIDGTSLPTDPVPVIGGVISGFVSGDTIDLTGIGFDPEGSANLSTGNELQVTEGGKTYGLQFDPVQNFSSDYFHLSSDSGVGTFVTENNTPCYCHGTRILTDHGEVAVEALRVGDLVETVLRGTAAPIVWVGRRDVDCIHHPNPGKVWPVRVSAGAFGVGRPHTDLWLSPDHAVYVNEVLIPVRYLLNGSTIAQVMVDSVTYHHIELAGHDVMLAEGLPAESFLDMKDGSNYANRPGPVRLYPDYSARMWEAFGCAPLIVTGPELATARRLVERCAATQQAACAGVRSHVSVARSARRRHNRRKLTTTEGLLWVDSGGSHGSGSCGVECSPRNVLPTSTDDGVSMAKNVVVP
jgi:autotransporter passenger strand-loop-strand repeat protein